MLIIVCLYCVAPGNQPSTVESSGFTVSNSVTLPADLSAAPSRSVGSFLIRNDAVALETVEQYPISLSSSTTYGGRVTVGNPAMININDDDSKC